MPVDIEVHEAHGALYVLDTARLLPPLPPQPDNRRSIFYQMFRAEFLALYKTPLSSDAFSVFGQLDREVHHRACRAAHQHLLDVTIPQVAQLLTAADAPHVTRVLQQRGVNCRFLGRVRRHVVDPVLRKAMLIEMTARVVQKRMREMWRQERRFSVLPLLRQTADALNELRAAGPAITDRIRTLLIGKFGADCVEDNEALPLRDAVPRACVLSGIVILNASDTYTTSDISIESCVKALSVSARAEAEGFALEAKGASRGELSLSSLFSLPLWLSRAVN